MSKKLSPLFVLGLLLLSLGSKAQESEVIKSITVGTDPSVFGLLGGVEAEVGYNHNKNRFTFLYQNTGLTPWFGQADDFDDDSEFTALEFGYSRFLNDNQEGFHYGLAYTYYPTFEITNDAGQTLDKSINKIGVRVGYKWFPFDGNSFEPFFVEPLINLGFFLDDEDLEFANGDVFDAKTFVGNGPLIHLGWKFDF